MKCFRLKFNNKIIYALGFVILAFFCSFLFVTDINSAIPGDEGLTLSPPIKELTLKPGERKAEVVKLTNPTENIVELYPTLMNFKAAGEGGEPTFYSASEEESKFSLASWIEINQTKIALAPEQVVEVKYEIVVPEDAEPGGHYGVVFFATEPPKIEGQEASQVALSSMVGSLILGKVPGDIIEEGELEEFKSDRRLYLNNKINIISRINNTGNIHFKPEGEITIKGIFGDSETLKINENRGNVLPDSIRRFDNEWKPKGIKVGRFKAEAKYTYGESEKVLAGTLVFWIIPWWLIVLTATLLVLVIVIFIWSRHKRKGPRPPKAKNDKTVEYDGNRVILR